MKKLALALGVAGIAAVPYLFSRAPSAVTSAAEGLITELGAVPELDRAVQKQGPYPPPPSGEPGRAQVEQLLEVQQAIRTRLGPGPRISSAAISGWSRETLTT